MQQPPRRVSDKDATWLTKIQSLPVEHRAYVFVFVMGVLGAIFGGMSTDAAMRDCVQRENCFVINPLEQRLNGIEAGALAGMAAALVLSFPALFKE